MTAHTMSPASARAAFGAFEPAGELERCTACARPSSEAGTLRRVPFFGQRAPYKRCELVTLTLCGRCYERPGLLARAIRAPRPLEASP